MSSETSEEQQEKGFIAEAWDTLKTVFWALVIAIIFRTFLFEPFNIPSGSMYPNLMVGDYMFVNKSSYGYSKYSFLFGFPPFEGRIIGSEPERGDVAVFRNPKQDGVDYVKRIVGLPGDRIQIKAGVLHINGEAVKRRRIEDYVINPETPFPESIKQYVETLPNGKSYNILEETDAGYLDNTKVFIVPEGHYFGMGDNRDNSSDSRVLSSVGYIPFDNLVGRATNLFYSADSRVKWYLPWTWFIGTRYDRLLHSVD
ncbi:signal peptidase I [Curvivirga aplysinae]|uniref:signal peptidase I n=1 Tax=Curvivirga aplysinae TaxID=2529852 RepID=UPI0012BD5690|nr:signal peptidase I [Curvivirga aplysinae]MTI09015.1 signal peptidase I [Curvivirga aplysinae]